MNLMLRLFGVGLVIGGLVLGRVTYSALRDVDERARFLAQVSIAMGEPIDAEQWGTRWRASSVSFAILAVGGVLAGAAFVVRHRLAWAALAAALSAHAAWLIGMRMRGARMYAFEPTLSQILATALVATYCSWAAWRSRQSTDRSTAI
jgi:hypothetical protein